MRKKIQKTDPNEEYNNYYSKSLAFIKMITQKPAMSK